MKSKGLARLKVVNCNLCKSKGVEVVYPATISKSGSTKFSYACTNDGHGEYYQIVRCKQCGLHFCSPRLNSSNLENEYSKLSDDIYQKELGGRIKTFQRNIVNISRYKKKGHLLDVGCSLGSFLSEAQKKEWIVEGIEPSSWCIKKAKELFNINIRQGTYKDLNKFGRKFDVITLWDVLEHLDDPLEALVKCREVLKDDGILVFSTVDIGSFYAKIMGKKWPWLMKMHIYYFDKKTIKEYLKKSGLSLIKIKKYKHTIGINYLLYKLKKINSLFYFLVKFIKKTIIFNKNIYITFGLGDFMEVYARKDFSLEV